MWSGLTSLFAAIGQALGLVSGRSALNNAPDVKAAAIAADEQAERDAETKATAAKDLTQTREQLAE